MFERFAKGIVQQPDRAEKKKEFDNPVPFLMLLRIINQIPH